MKTGVNIALLAALVICLALNWVLSDRSDRPNYRFLPDMADSPAYSAFEPNPNFADGKTLRTPVAGAIARGHAPLHYGATPEDAARAGRELTNPLSYSDARALTRGRDVFSNFCQHCHGATGKGDGLVAQRGFPPPPSLLAERALNLPDGQIFHILTYGQGNMPSHASQIAPHDRWSAILYVRSLQGRKPATSSLAAGKEAQ